MTYDKEQQRLAVKAKYIDYKTDENYKDLIDCKNTRTEALAELPFFKDGKYADRIDENMDDANEQNCALKEFISEYLTDVAKYTAKCDADGISIEEMEEEMSSYISPKCRADNDLIRTIMAIGLVPAEGV